MNLLTIKNNNLIGYNVYDFLKYYKSLGEYDIDSDDVGTLIIYEQFFPYQILKTQLRENDKIINYYLDERINNFYELSKTKLHKVKNICFFYPFTFYSKNDFNFNFINILKRKIEIKFNLNVFFILNNYFSDNNFNHFSAFRYDIFNDARKHIKIKNNIQKEKIFISLNAKIRKHRDDLHDFMIKENILKNSFFSYTQKNIDLWQTNDFKEFVRKYLINEEGSGHLTFEYYLNDDFFNTKNSMFFDKSFYYIITETSHEDNLCFISEKTYKSFYHKIPFLVIGNPHTIKNLRNEGFKTFNNWIDESYDNEMDYEKRKNLIYNEIKRLNSLTVNQHYKIINEMNDILEFNHNHFFNNNNFKEDFLKLFKKNIFN